MIEQRDKTKVFQNLFEKAVQTNMIKERVFKMAKLFAKRGGTKNNVRAYQKLDRKIKEAAKGGATKVGERSIGICTI